MKLLILLTSLMNLAAGAEDLNPAKVMEEVSKTGEAAPCDTRTPAASTQVDTDERSEAKLSIDCSEVEKEPGKTEFKEFIESGLFKDKPKSRTVYFYQPKGIDVKNLGGIKIRRRVSASGDSEVMVKIRPANKELIAAVAASNAEPKAKSKAKISIKCEEDRAEDTKEMSCSFSVGPASKLSDAQIAWVKQWKGVTLSKADLSTENDQYSVTDEAVTEEYSSLSREKLKQNRKFRKLPEIDLEIWRDPKSKACKSIMISSKVTTDESRKAMRRMNKLLRRFDVPKAEVQGFKSQ